MERDKLYVLIEEQGVTWEWLTPPTGFEKAKVKYVRYYHPDTQFYIAAMPGVKAKWPVVSNAVMLALQGAGKSVSVFRDIGPRRTKKTVDISPEQVKMWD